MKLLIGLFFTLLFSLCPATEVINAGVGGNRTTHILKRLDRDVLSKKPTLVVLMVGTNDRLNSGGFVSLSNYLKNLETIREAIQKSGSKLIVITPPPCLPNLLFTRHDPDKFSDQAPNERIKELRFELLKFAKSHQLPIVDFHKYLIVNKLAGDNENSVLRNPANSGSKDGVHLTETGYQLLAKLVAEQIRETQANTTKVICLGDSLTKGPASGISYPMALADLLK